jgi:hypothetical protein
MMCSRVLAALALLAIFAPACRGPQSSSEPASSAAPETRASAPLSSLEPVSLRPISSAAIEAARQVQARKLDLTPSRARATKLAFGRGVLGQLTDNEVRVFDTRDFKLRGSHSLEGPRVLVELADGGLLAVGSSQALRFDPHNGKFSTSPRPVLLLPGVELRADAVSADRVWLFDAGSSSDASARPPKLSSFLLTPSAVGLLLPDREASLELEPGGVLGATREGVWLYVGKKQAERLGPGGARLSKLRMPELTDLLWMLPARRLDQAYLVHSGGGVSRAVVSPTFKQLGSVRLAGAPWAAVSGDEGRLLAAIVVTGEGPRFELQLLDAELEASGRASLPSEAPTGTEDWLKVVTRNQDLAASAHEPRVAVGGPDRVLVFDGQGNQLFSIPSR